jgi:hypothetical protein
MPAVGFPGAAMPTAAAEVSAPPAEPVELSGPSAAPRVRLGIETISDVVFGLSLEIGSIALVSKLPQNAADLTRGVVEFGFTFVIIFMVWFAYRRAIVVFPYETQQTLIVNVAILFCVAIEPFLFYVSVVATGTIVGGAASTAFALDVGAMMLLLAAFYFLLFAEDRRVSHRPIPPEILQSLRGASLGRVVAGVIFLVSALPLFDTAGVLGTTVREDVWIASLSLFLVVQYGLRPHPGGRSPRGPPPGERRGSLSGERRES